MGLRRSRDSSMMWPGFVDAVTTLLMVLMFVLTIFTVMQSVLRETITTQDSELDQLTAQVADLADALGLERRKVADLQGEVGTLNATLTEARAKGEEQSALIATLTGQISARENELAAAEGRIASFEAQVASLLSERDAARDEAGDLAAKVADLEAAGTRLISEKEALVAALTGPDSTAHADAESRMRLRSIDVQLLRILEEISAGRQESLADLRGDISALTASVRQLSRLATGRA